MNAPYGCLAAAPPRLATRPINLTRLLEMHAKGEKIAAITAHDATFSGIAARAGVECILVGEDLATAYQGHAIQENMTLDALAYHVTNVSEGLRSAQASAWVVCDLPAHSHGGDLGVAMRHAGMLIKAGAHMLRMQTDENFAAIASFLRARGVAVCGHLKSVKPCQHASAVQSMADSGCNFVVLEGIDNVALSAIASALPHCVTLGLQSGPNTSGQLLPLQVLLGVATRSGVKTGETYLSRSGSIQGAVAAYVADVKANTQIRDGNWFA